MGEPSGLMVLHAWVEPVDRMRVRVTRTVDVQSPRTETSYAGTTADTLRLVEQWLAECGFPPGSNRRE